VNSTAAKPTPGLMIVSRMNLVGLVFGILFGAVLGASNLHEYDTIHFMLRLDEFDVFLFMGSAIAVSAPILWLLERRGFVTPLGGKLALSRSLPERHHLKGGALFGVGWAIAGTCPAPALVMISSGAWMGLVALLGIFLGLHLREREARRQLRSGKVDITSRSLRPNVS
jgi:uncharacterized membrane protein YedE/YeeE